MYLNIENSGDLCQLRMKFLQKKWGVVARIIPMALFLDGKMCQKPTSPRASVDAHSHEVVPTQPMMSLQAIEQSLETLEHRPLRFHMIEPQVSAYQRPRRTPTLKTPKLQHYKTPARYKVFRGPIDRVGPVGHHGQTIAEEYANKGPVEGLGRSVCLTHRVHCTLVTHLCMSHTGNNPKMSARKTARTVKS